MGNALPAISVFSYYRPEDPDFTGGQRMEFHLLYQGALPVEKCKDDGTSARAKDKHFLRKHFHPQLRELWNQHPDLKAQAETLYLKSRFADNKLSWPGPEVAHIIPIAKNDPAASASNVKTWIEHIADDHQRCGGRFVPLISEAGGFTCSLDILFLRRDNPGSLIANGGDIDNRIKVLFDGLRMPNTVQELGGYQIDSNDENPFFCLLEDDRLVTKVSVTTDRLIAPQATTENINDVYLVIHVTMVNPSSIFAGGRLV